MAKLSKQHQNTPYHCYKYILKILKKGLCYLLWESRETYRYINCVSDMQRCERKCSFIDLQRVLREQRKFKDRVNETDDKTAIYVRPE
jgi:hypothetical protein